ncbi:MAG: type II toxin-antitoxin system HicB family antitoxin [Terracidiphilus sp.]
MKSSFQISQGAFPLWTTGKRSIAWPGGSGCHISLPGALLSQIDSYAQARHLTRSGFLAKAALEAMSNQ